MRVVGMPVTWPEYVRRVTRGQTATEIANRTGISDTNIGRWLRGERRRPTPDIVLKFAEAYGQPPLEALIAADYLTDADVNINRTPLSAYSYAELIAELARRNPDDS